MNPAEVWLGHLSWMALSEAANRSMVPLVHRQVLDTGEPVRPSHVTIERAGEAVAGARPSIYRQRLLGMVVV